MTKQFDPASWREGARQMDQARESWERQAFGATQSKATGGFSVLGLQFGAPVDMDVKQHTQSLRDTWYDLIGNVGVVMGSDSSKMLSTANNYSSTEQQAVEANQRFWGQR